MIRLQLAWRAANHANYQATVSMIGVVSQASKPGVQPITLGKRVLDDPRHFNFWRQKHQKFCDFLQTLNGRLPPKDGSDWPETWPKRVSDDPRNFIFRLLKFLFRWASLSKTFFDRKKASATFRRIKANVPGYMRFLIQIRTNPGTFVSIP